MSWSRWPKGPEAVRRDVIVSAMAMTLRSALDLSPYDMAPGERAAWRGRSLVAMARNVDLGAWIAWALAGLPLFTHEPIPTMREVLHEARRVALALAMDRTGGNVTSTGAVLDMSRRNVRERLKAAGLYQIDPHIDDQGPGLPVVMTSDDGEAPDEI